MKLCRKTTKPMNTARQHSLKLEVKSLEEVKNAVEERLVNVRSECEDAKNQSILSSNRTEELEKERTIMLDYIKEMQSKIGDLESKITNDNKASSSKIRCWRIVWPT